MSILFTPKSIGNLELPNRFVASATYEGMADDEGHVGSELIRKYEKLAKGGVGLAITGLMGIHRNGGGLQWTTSVLLQQRIS